MADGEDREFPCGTERGQSGVTGVLASVTSIDEARIALEAGAAIIDLKNPAQGALGALPLPVIEQIVRFVDGRKPVSATVGDLPAQPLMLDHAVRAVAATGVDIVKIGLFGQQGHIECVRGLADAVREGCKIVAVLFADQEPDFSLLPLLADIGFYGAMLDTAEKTAGGLLYWIDEDRLQDFVGMARSRGLLTGLAGSLRETDIAALALLGADYLGFRGALCSNYQRQASLDPARMNLIAGAVAQMQQAACING